MNEHRSSTLRICGVVERPDHHCGDDLVNIVTVCIGSTTLSLHEEVLR